MSTPGDNVAVVIVSWNCLGHLRDCLTSLRDLRPRPVEVVVVDNGSTDGTPDRLPAEFPEVELLTNPRNLGFCRANNRGIAATSAPLVLVLNPDTKLTPGFLGALAPAFEEPEVGIAAGKLLRFDGVTLDSAGQRLGRSRQPVDRGYGRPDRGQFDSDGEVFGACGAAAMYRRAMLDELAAPDGAYFDETFFAFYEDLDLAWRARNRGWKAVYRHEAVGYHARGGTARGSERARRLAAMLARTPEIRLHIVKNRYLTILRNDSWRGYLANLPFILVRDVATIALLATTSPAVLSRLWRSRDLFRRALSQRREDVLRWTA